MIPLRILCLFFAILATQPVFSNSFYSEPQVDCFYRDSCCPTPQPKPRRRPPKRDCGYFYLGADGGWSTQFSSDRPKDAGANFQGYSLREDRSGFNAGANIGFKCSRGFRTDISYTYFKSDYDWHTFFVDEGSNSRVDADLESHIILFNMYIHLNEVCCLPCKGWCIDPYIQGGAGVSINNLFRILESVNSGPTANVFSNTKSNFAGRFGLGILFPRKGGFIWDTGFNVTYIGTVQSDNKRLIIGNDEPTDIGRYKFKNNWIGSFYLGIKFNLCCL